MSLKKTPNSIRFKFGALGALIGFALLPLASQGASVNPASSQLEQDLRTQVHSVVQKLIGTESILSLTVRVEATQTYNPTPKENPKEPTEAMNLTFAPGGWVKPKREPAEVRNTGDLNVKRVLIDLILKANLTDAQNNSLTGVLKQTAQPFNTEVKISTIDPTQFKIEKSQDLDPPSLWSKISPEILKQGIYLLVGILFLSGVLIWFSRFVHKIIEKIFAHQNSKSETQARLQSDSAPTEQIFRTQSERLPDPVQNEQTDRKIVQQVAALTKVLETRSRDFFEVLLNDPNLDTAYLGALLPHLSDTQREVLAKGLGELADELAGESPHHIPPEHFLKWVSVTLEKSLRIGLSKRKDLTLSFGLQNVLTWITRDHLKTSPAFWSFCLGNFDASTLWQTAQSLDKQAQDAFFTSLVKGSSTEEKASVLAELKNDLGIADADGSQRGKIPFSPGKARALIDLLKDFSLSEEAMRFKQIFKTYPDLKIQIQNNYWSLLEVGIIPLSTLTLSLDKLQIDQIAYLLFFAELADEFELTNVIKKAIKSEKKRQMTLDELQGIQANTQSKETLIEKSNDLRQWLEDLRQRAKRREFKCLIVPIQSEESKTNPTEPPSSNTPEQAA